MGMMDPFGRNISYLRLSVTDRCDLRCIYCMAEHMTFLPKRDLLTLEELDRLATCFINKGVRKLRVTGGEPLVRKDILSFFAAMGRHLKSGMLDELTLTTNGSQLAQHAEALAEAGVRRINVSLDTLDPAIYTRLTRGGQIEKVLAGIEAAQEAGMVVKINCVALKQDNAVHIEEMIHWAHAKGCTMTLIEVMPLGDVDEDRFDQFIPLTEIRERLVKKYTLTDSAKRTGGPSRYAHIAETGGEIGFITPLTQNFCEGCNRVRVTCTGQLFMCLGQNDNADLRAVLRASSDNTDLSKAIDEAIGRKPKAHDFLIKEPGVAPAVPRHMSMTGG